MDPALVVTVALVSLAVGALGARLVRGRRPPPRPLPRAEVPDPARLALEQLPIGVLLFAGQRRRDRFCPKNPGMRRRGVGGSGRKLRLAQEPLRDQKICQRGDPFLVIGEARVILRGQAFARVPRGIDVPRAKPARRQRQRQRASVPIPVEGHDPLRLGQDGTIAVAPAHVMRPGQDGTPGSPVPIIESRVTRAARSASPNPSVPAGRIGMTR